MTASPGQARPITIRAHHRATAVFGALVSLALALALGAPASAAPTDCLVTNLDTSQTSTALQAAVDAASPGHRLIVQGTCHGTTVIAKDLVISGLETKTSGGPTLDGDGLGSVVMVHGVTVTIEDLVIEGGVASRRAPRDGGGLTNRDGTLTLRDVLVRGNRAKRGGGIFTTGSVSLEGATRIFGNVAEEGAGGVKVVGGSLTMNGSSAIEGNTASLAFAGVLLDGATLVMNGHSSIRGNRPSGVRARRPSSIVMNDHSSIRGNEPRGGVHLDSGPSLTMNDLSTITRNTSGKDGGGVELYRADLTMNDSSTITRNTAGTLYELHGGGGIHIYGGTLVGVSCAPRANANVFDNAPDDCIRNGHPFQ